MTNEPIELCEHTISPNNLMEWQMSRHLFRMSGRQKISCANRGSIGYTRIDKIRMNIVLTGFMGTGKTAVGKVLAKRIKMRFVDIDGLIVKSDGRSISNIFKEEGEQYFRKIEKWMVRDISRSDNLVIATGGGVMLDEDNVAALQKRGILICLTASPEEILRRINRMRKRPLLNCKNPKKMLELILKRRKPYYKRADMTIKTDGLSIHRVVKRIIEGLNELRN